MTIRTRLLAFVGAAAVVAAPLAVAAPALASSGHPVKHFTNAQLVARSAVASTATPACSITPGAANQVEAGDGLAASSVAFVFNVHCRAIYSEDVVEVDATTLYSVCAESLSGFQPGAYTEVTEDTTPDQTGPYYNVTLDDDGNAILVLEGGPSCAGGTTNTIYASLTDYPYSEAMTSVHISAPRETKAGLSASPAAETEDANYGDVATVLYAETPPGTGSVSYTDANLYDRCADLLWYGPDEVLLSDGTKSATESSDFDGNSFVVLVGEGCAAGPTIADAQLVNAPYTSYPTMFTVRPPGL